MFPKFSDKFKWENRISLRADFVRLDNLWSFQFWASPLRLILWILCKKYMNRSVVSCNVSLTFGWNSEPPWITPSLSIPFEDFAVRWQHLTRPHSTAIRQKKGPRNLAARWPIASPSSHGIPCYPMVGAWLGHGWGRASEIRTHRTSGATRMLRLRRASSSFLASIVIWKWFFCIFLMCHHESTSTR